jgi:hypothetical protein
VVDTTIKDHTTVTVAAAVAGGARERTLATRALKQEEVRQDTQTPVLDLLFMEDILQLTQTGLVEEDLAGGAAVVVVTQATTTMEVMAVLVILLMKIFLIILLQVLVMQNIFLMALWKRLLGILTMETLDQQTLKILFV